MNATLVIAQTTERPYPTDGSEAHLVLPALNTGLFPGGLSGTAIVTAGIVICLLGTIFSLYFFNQLRKLPVHKAMRDMSELIYQTCKTYLISQGKFILILECFLGVIIVAYFILQGMMAHEIIIILLFSLIGIAGSYGVGGCPWTILPFLLSGQAVWGYFIRLSPLAGS